jgi:hypothetical protein
MFRPGANKPSEPSAEEIAEARLRIRKNTELNERLETSLKNAQWAALNNKGLRDVYTALPEVLPSIQNTEALEAVCAPVISIL